MLSTVPRRSFCVSCACCWCRDQCRWLSGTSFWTVVMAVWISALQLHLLILLGSFYNINKQSAWNVLIQNRFFIILACSSWSTGTCWIRSWFRVWTTCAFSLWLAIRSWVILLSDADSEILDNSAEIDWDTDCDTETDASVLAWYQLKSL